MLTEAVRNPFVEQLSLSPQTTPAAATSKGKHLEFLNFRSLYQLGSCYGYLDSLLFVFESFRALLPEGTVVAGMCVFYNWLGLSLAILFS